MDWISGILFILLKKMDMSIAQILVRNRKGYAEDQRYDHLAGSKP